MSPHRFPCLNTWTSARRAVYEGCETSKKWSLAGGSTSWGWGLRLYSPTSLPVLFLQVQWRPAASCSICGTLSRFCPFTTRVNRCLSDSMPEETLPTLNCFLLQFRSYSAMWQNTIQMKIQKTKAISHLCGPILYYIVILRKQLLLPKMTLLKRPQSQSPSLVWSPVIHPSHYTDSGLPGVWAQSSSQDI